MAGSQLQVKLNDQVSLTAGVMAGPSRTLGALSPRDTGPNRIDVTATFGVIISIN